MPLGKKKRTKIHRARFKVSLTDSEPCYASVTVFVVHLAPAIWIRSTLYHT